MDKEFNEDISIVQKEKYKLLKESVICPICNKIFIDPIICIECQASICKICYEKVKNYRNQCNCMDSNYQINILKINILSNLKYKCNKCGKYITYYELKSHMNGNCLNNINFNNINGQISEFKIKRIFYKEFNDLKEQGKEIIQMTSNYKYIIILIYLL